MQDESDKKVFTFNLEQQNAHKNCFRRFWEFIRKEDYNNDDMALAYFKELNR